MKTERYISDEGEFRCFGFPNTLIGKSGTRYVLKQIPELNIQYFKTGMFIENFCEFTYKEQKFIVSEPFGDNSYFDIYCETPNTQELEELHQIFANTKLPTPNVLRGILGLLIFIIVIGFVINSGSANAT